jgi:hypothetical protein
MCRDCRASGWGTLCQETIGCEVEESFRLCPTCSAPRCQVGSQGPNPCGRPAAVLRDAMIHAYEEHADVLHAIAGVDLANEAVFYLRRWL